METPDPEWFDRSKHDRQTQTTRLVIVGNAPLKSKTIPNERKECSSARAVSSQNTKSRRLYVFDLDFTRPSVGVSSTSEKSHKGLW